MCFDAFDGKKSDQIFLGQSDNQNLKFADFVLRSPKKVGKLAVFCFSGLYYKPKISAVKPEELLYGSGKR